MVVDVFILEKLKITFESNEGWISLFFFIFFLLVVRFEFNANTIGWFEWAEVDVQNLPTTLTHHRVRMSSRKRMKTKRIMSNECSATINSIGYHRRAMRIGHGTVRRRIAEFNFHKTVEISFRSAAHYFSVLFNWLAQDALNTIESSIAGSFVTSSSSSSSCLCSVRCWEL